jgi:hypothetical protein
MKSKWLNKVPVFLSALVCPGIGQLVQKRWTAGAFYSIGFISSFIWFMVRAAHIIIYYYKLGFEFDTTETEVISATTLITPFVLAMTLYLINIIDVIIANQRLKQTAREQALYSENPTS